MKYLKPKVVGLRRRNGLFSKFIKHLPGAEQGLTLSSEPAVTAVQV